MTAGGGRVTIGGRGSTVGVGGSTDGTTMTGVGGGEETGDWGVTISSICDSGPKPTTLAQLPFSDTCIVFSKVFVNVYYFVVDNLIDFHWLHCLL